MITKYKVNTINLNEIKMVEVERETEKTVYFKNKIAERKETNWQWYFDIFEDARMKLVELLTKKLDNNKKAIEVAEKNIRNVSNMLEIVRNLKETDLQS